MKNIIFNRKPIVSILIGMLVICALPGISYGSSDDISVVASTDSPLTEATLHESVVTLTLSGGAYERSGFTIRDAVEVSGIDGVTVGTFGIDRVSDTEITVELEFEDNMDTDATLTFTVGADALVGYNGPALTTQIPVTANMEAVVASTAAPLTEATLHESVVTLTLSGGDYEQSGFKIRDAVEVSGIDGTTVGTFGVERVSDTKITVELEFEGNMDTDATLTFTVGADALVGYNGPALTTQIPVTANMEAVVASTAAPLTEATLHESVVTLTLSGGDYEQSGFKIRDAVEVSGIDGTTVGTFGVERVSDTKITVELEFEGNMDTDATLTFTVGADALVGYNGPVLTAQIPVSATRSVIASTSAPLTEATLHESVVTLTLSGGAYEQAVSDIRGAVAVSGIDGVTFGIERVSDTEITVKLEFNGTDFDTDATLTFTVGADALVGYNGPVLTAQIPVSATRSVIASTSAPLTEATLHESVVTLTLSGGAYEQAVSDIRGAVAVSGIDGVTFGIERVSDTEITVKLEFNGTDFDTDATLTFTVGADALAGYNGPVLTAQIPVSATRSVIASTSAPLTEATLHESVVTLTLSGGAYEQAVSDIRGAVAVSGIDGVTFGIERVSDTEITVKLEFNGTDFDTDATLTFTVGADALAGYNGSPLTAQIAVAAITETVVASTASPLTEATLHESVVTLTLSGGAYEQAVSDIRGAVAVSGIDGVTFGIERVSDTEITVKLEFNGNIDTDATLTFTVGADALAGYNGSPLTTQIPVTATRSVVASTAAPLTEATLHESVVTLTLSGGAYEQAVSDIRGAVAVSGIDGVTFGVERVSDTEITVKLEFNGNIDTDATLTFTVGADALAGYNGSPLTTQIPVAAITETVVASTAAPLTEATLHESVVTLTLSGGAYEQAVSDIRDAVAVSGIDGVTFGVERVSDTEITVELEFDGNIDTDATLTFTVGADAIVGYNGPALTAQIPVTANMEAVVASTAAPLTEATLHESVVTLTLSGGAYARFIRDIRDAVEVSGIDGVTVGTFGIDRVSDTEITVELEFDGNIDTDATLTFTVGADAIVGYNGSPLTAQIPVTAITESVAAFTVSPLTKATLHGSEVTLILSGGTWSTWDIRDAVKVSGIEGVTVGISDVEHVSDTEITIELEFDGNMEGNIDTDVTLTFTVGADAIAGYNGPALTATPVVLTASVAVFTVSPLTEATLHESVVTLTLSGGAYEQSVSDIRGALMVSGIEGVTFDVERVSDTEITIELKFDGNTDGNIDTDATLTFTVGATIDIGVTFTVGANAIADYNGPTLTTQTPVTVNVPDTTTTGYGICVAFPSYGTLLASVLEDGTIKLWDVATNANIATLKGHEGVVWSVAFSPDGKMLASAGGDGTVRLWDVATNTNIATLEGHEGLVTAVAFSPDGTLLASAGRDATVRLWDVATNTNIATLEGHTDGVVSVAFSPDGTMLASGSWIIRSSCGT